MIMGPRSSCGSSGSKADSERYLLSFISCLVGVSGAGVSVVRPLENRAGEALDRRSVGKGLELGARGDSDGPVHFGGRRIFRRETAISATSGEYWRAGDSGGDWAKYGGGLIGKYRPPAGWAVK